MLKKITLIKIKSSKVIRFTLAYFTLLYFIVFKVKNEVLIKKRIEKLNAAYHFIWC